MLLSDDWAGLLLNFGTEMAGAVATYILLELVIGRWERGEAERAEREARKAHLIAQLGSKVKDVAAAAAEEIRREGWLSDGSLQGAHLLRANLQGADLIVANLQGADLRKANLKDVNLEMADLRDANLQGARLSGANLQWGLLPGVKFDEEITLPDSTNWTSDTDLARFTHPEHPDF